jgi:hypothetical protein
MGTITDSEDWLDQAYPADHEEVYALYMAVLNDDQFGIFGCTPSPDNSSWFVKSGTVEHMLLLESPQEKEAFLALIHSRYGDPELDMHAWYHFMSSMS